MFPLHWIVTSKLTKYQHFSSKNHDILIKIGSSYLVNGLLCKAKPHLIIYFSEGWDKLARDPRLEHSAVHARGHFDTLAVVNLLISALAIND